MAMCAASGQIFGPIASTTGRDKVHLHLEIQHVRLPRIEVLRPACSRNSPTSRGPSADGELDALLFRLARGEAQIAPRVSDAARARRRREGTPAMMCNASERLRVANG
jgi:hypothetical protein